MRNLFTWGCVALVAGVVIAVIGMKEKGLADAASQTPEEISLRDLIARGPDGNPNIILTDFVLCENFVYQSRYGSWQNAWVPAVPREAPDQVHGGRPGVVPALIFTINARDEADLYQRCGQPRLKALVTNRIVSLGGQERALLQKSYGRTNFDNCLIIQEGREPAGGLKILLMVGGGSLAALAGLGLLGYASYQWCHPPKPRKKRKRQLAADEDEYRSADRRRDDFGEPRPRRRRGPED